MDVAHAHAFGDERAQAKQGSRGAGGHGVMVAAAGRPGQVGFWSARQAGAPAGIPSGNAALVPHPKTDDKRHTGSYGVAMKPFRWSSAKNEVLQVQRGVSFEAVVVAIESGDLLDIVEHPNQARYPGQRILVVLISGYVHLVPYIEADDHLFLKTIIPSRKATIAYRPGDAP